MPLVNVPGVGQLNFPDGMSQQDMAAAIQKNYPQIHQQAAPPQQDSALKQTLMAPVGALEELGKLASGAIAAPIAGAAYAGSAIGKALGANTDPAAVQSKVQNALTYQPQSNSGQAADQAISGGVHAVAAPLVAGAQHVGSAITSAVPAAAPFVQAAPGALQAAASLIPGLKMGTAAVDAAGAARAAAEANTTDAERAGYKSAVDHPIAAGAAGQGGMDALTLRNQQVGNVRLGSQVGVPQGSALDAKPGGSLDQAAEAPNAVFNRTAQGLPTVPLSDAATQQIQSAGTGDLVTHSPDAQGILDTQKARLLSGDPQTGDQVVNNMRTLRQEGFKRMGSDDIEQQNLGRAQLQMANALEQHVADNLPANGDVSLDQFQQARTALAQNHALSGALVGNNVNLQAMARMQRADPGLLTGEFDTAATFANQHPKVSGLANRIEVPPSFQNDIGQALNSARSHDVVGRMLGASGISAWARNALTGDTAGDIANLRQTLPGSNASRFAPLEPQAPQAPNLTTGVGANPNPSPSQPLGDFAHVMSQGVEQAPPQGLSAGPMGAPQQGGLPFQAPPESIGAKFVHGGAPVSGTPFGLDGEPLSDHPDVAQQSGIRLGDRFAGPTAQVPLGNVADVMHQGRAGGIMTPTSSTEPQLHQGPGVPEDIAARAPTAPAIQHTADEDTGQHIVTSPNGQSLGQESGPFLLEKRTDTTPDAQGKGEGVARTEALIQQAEHRGLRYGSDVSVSPAMQRVYESALVRRGYVVGRNPNATVNPETGNLVSDDPRKPVYTVRTPLSMALAR